MAGRYGVRQGLDRTAARVGAAAGTQSGFGGGPGLSAASRQYGTQSHGRPDWHFDRHIRCRAHQHLIENPHGERPMTAAVIPAGIVAQRPAWRSLRWSLPLVLLWTLLITWQPAITASGVPTAAARLITYG